MADRNKNRNKSGFLQKLERCRKTEIGLYPAKFCRGFNGTLGFFLPLTVGEKTTFFWDPVESKHRLGDDTKFYVKRTVWFPIRFCRNVLTFPFWFCRNEIPIPARIKSYSYWNEVTFPIRFCWNVLTFPFRFCQNEIPIATRMKSHS